MDSHEHIAPYANSECWAFGVDGDEIYDPKRLAQFRIELLAGQHDDWWLLLGNVVHCVEIDTLHNTAKGYLTPPSKSMTKLYNFNAIKSWSGRMERFSGPGMVFKDGFQWDLRKKFYQEFSWNDSLFRCLHACFVPRSRSVVSKRILRPLPGETPLVYRLLDYIGAGQFISRPLQSRKSTYKMDKYGRGDLIDIDVSDFFDNGV